jgi:hypothetical protein
MLPCIRGNVVVFVYAKNLISTNIDQLETVILLTGNSQALAPWIA